MMRRIAIIGAGQAGLVLGIGLLKHGYNVTIFSDQTSADYLRQSGRPTSTIHSDAYEIERALGMNLWDDVAPCYSGINVELSTPDPIPLFTLRGNYPSNAVTIDQRLKFSQWLQLFEQCGGCLVIETITTSRLDELAAQFDLVVVAVGKGTVIEQVFRRDASRSVTFDEPKRTVFMVNIRDYATNSETHDRITISIVSDVGELFWVPFYDRDAGRSFSVGLGAVPSASLDIFRDVTSASEGLNKLKLWIDKYLPWKSSFLASAVPTHTTTWLNGAVMPIVRHPIGCLPSGRIVLGIGDVVILNDPTAGQGANNATKMAYHTMQKIIQHGTEPFHAEWMQELFEEFWQYSQHTNELSNLLLDPLQSFQQDIMLAGSFRQSIADDFVGGFNHPPSLFPWFGNETDARKYLADKKIRGLSMAYHKGKIAARILKAKIGKPPSGFD